MITIDGKNYIEKNTDDLPYGNVCRYCAFYKTSCYNRKDFSCHSDSRQDRQDVIFVENIKNENHNNLPMPTHPHSLRSQARSKS